MTFHFTLFEILINCSGVAEVRRDAFTFQFAVYPPRVVLICFWSGGWAALLHLTQPATFCSALHSTCFATAFWFLTGNQATGAPSFRGGGLPNQTTTAKSEARGNLLTPWFSSVKHEIHIYIYIFIDIYTTGIIICLLYCT